MGFRVFPWIFIFFYWFFRGLEWSHDVPDPSGIIFGPGITQNGGMKLSFDQCWTFLYFFWTPGDPLGPLGARKAKFDKEQRYPSP